MPSPRRCENFSPTNTNSSNGQGNDDNGALGEIYFESYRGAVFQFQEEIEANNIPIDEIFPHIHNHDGFVQDVIVFLEERVTLPSQVSTVQELIKEATNTHRALAVFESFYKMIAVLLRIPDYDTCLQCWVCQANITQQCASCKVASFCGAACQRMAWKRNHKVMCPRFRHIREYAQTQCQKIVKVHKQAYIPGSLLVPSLFFDYIMVSVSAGQTPPGDDQAPSMDHFYKNIVKVASDDQSFCTLFKHQSDVGDDDNSDNPEYLTKGMSELCIRLMYMNGNPPPRRLLESVFIPSLTRDAFLNEYKKKSGYPPQSEEMVMAYITYGGCKKNSEYPPQSEEMIVGLGMDNLFQRHRR
jgi:MYND finger